MCRRNRLYGCCLVSLGIGLLIGRWLSSGFFCVIFAGIVIALGLGILRQR